jgi:hypothetical protein
MQICLAVQVRREIAVDPCVVCIRRHRDGPAGRRGQATHQLRLDMAVDLTFVYLHPLEPAVVFLETKQRFGEVKQYSADLAQPLPPNYVRD